MNGRFDGKAALITGAGSGMGRAIARRLGDEGARVLAVDIDADALAETNRLTPDSVVTRAADVSSRAACFETVAAAVAELGRLDVLGNVAGIFRARHFVDIDEDEYRRVMAVNLDGYFFLAQAAIPHLLEADGNIVNIASNSGIQGIPYAAAYAMSKGGVVQLTRALAVEFLKQPLRVNAIAPAGTNTNISSGAEFPTDADIDLMIRMGGHRGRAEPEEVAGLFAFLASFFNDTATTEIYTLDNGLTAS
jgi:NAD(P)-dependent dehydrogenase (short-subunit alcohol dehydrogenase family)